MEISEVQQFINNKEYKKASKALDELIAKGDGLGELWFLKGVVSLKMRNYRVAHEYLERALMVEKKAEYYRVKGMAHFEIFEIEDAIENFKEALAMDENDVTANFFLSISYMFLDNPQAEEYLKKAKEIDSKKTKQLLRNFYSMFLKDDPKISEAQKRKIEERISKI